MEILVGLGLFGAAYFLAKKQAGSASSTTKPGMVNTRKEPPALTLNDFIAGRFRKPSGAGMEGASSSGSGGGVPQYPIHTSPGFRP